ncbi:hypothetical protein Rleg_5877 (plasmid) [Rhizobium leguminosarum bv. trifolii WSM1325]|uniref:Uncharacterized protein n=1 Tax=Rhizobium leguminosarum bv. trifolii (strain WSM1325) TaxID=395491 RepID=C6B8B5_RHILS|nr:hypothetical protein Rleg_5877 [Rhizobium leguminosarum bv. trifolii WSM1325]
MALLSRRHRIPLGIPIRGKEGTISRDVSVEAAITEIAKNQQARASTLLGISANSGTNAVGERRGMPYGGNFDTAILRCLCATNSFCR